MNDELRHHIAVEQLRVGLYIHLDLGWMDHPFTFGNFKIKEQSQIDTIRGLGLKRLRYDPLRSDCGPLPLAEIPAQPAAAAAAIAAPPPAPMAEPEHAADEIQCRHLARLHEMQRALDESEQKFLAASDTARQAILNIRSHPRQAIHEVETLIHDMVDSVLTENDIAIQAINGSHSGDEHYLHPLNVTVLALMMAKSLDMSAQDARLLGMAALFHDIGKTEIPAALVTKTEPLTSAELAQLQQHSELGARIAREAGMPERVADIILEHHECTNGSGFPAHLTESQIDPLARLLAIVNGYDNLCNPVNVAQAMTPYEALAHMFAHQRSGFDGGLLKRMIKSLGVYPPGSIVQLSNGAYAIAISVNPNAPLRPFVLVHEPQTSRDKPLILNLSAEPALNISLCLRPNQLPAEAFNYLNPRKRISYYLNTDLPQQQD